MYTVLVVEDSDMKIPTSYLQQAGYSVITAGSSDEVWEKLNNYKPDVIFLDVLLQGKSGFEICRELKNNPETSKIPVILCSTKNSEADRIWANMLGAEAYLLKPIDKEEVEVTLKRLLN